MSDELDYNKIHYRVDSDFKIGEPDEDGEQCWHGRMYGECYQTFEEALAYFQESVEGGDAGESYDLTLINTDEYGEKLNPFFNDEEYLLCQEVTND